MYRTGSRHQCGRWTNAEDEILMLQVMSQELLGQPKDWSSTAAIISSRSNKDCRKRWVRLNGCIKKGEWSSSEDTQLRDAFEQFGARWVQGSRYIKTRSADWCAAGWQGYLDPNIERQRWSHDEDQRLLQAYCIHGSNWKMIQMHELIDRSLQDIRVSYKSPFRLCSRSNAPSFIPSTANLEIINHTHDLPPMPSYEMFSLNSPHYPPDDIITFVAENPSASTCCTTPMADDSTSGILDSATDFQSPMQWNDQLNNVSRPIAESTDSMHSSMTGHIEVGINNSTWYGNEHNG
ncbi:Homeodomain-like protein [Trichoderma compactum]